MAPAPVTGPQHAFTLAGLAQGGSDRQQVEEWLADYVDRIDLGDTYDDLLDMLDGSPWRMPDGAWGRVEVPDRIDDPVYVRLRNIARRIRQELS